MKAPGRRSLTYAVIGTVMIGVGIAFAVFLVRQGLDNADKISSIVSMFAGVGSLVVGIWSFRQAALAHGPVDGPKNFVKNAHGNGAVVVGDNQVVTVSAGEFRRPWWRFWR